MRKVEHYDIDILALTTISVRKILVFLVNHVSVHIPTTDIDIDRQPLMRSSILGSDNRIKVGQMIRQNITIYKTTLHLS